MDTSEDRDELFDVGGMNNELSLCFGPNGDVGGVNNGDTNLCLPRLLSSSVEETDVDRVGSCDGDESEPRTLDCSDDGLKSTNARAEAERMEVLDKNLGRTSGPLPSSEVVGEYTGRGDRRPFCAGSSFSFSALFGLSLTLELLGFLLCPSKVPFLPRVR